VRRRRQPLLPTLVAGESLRFCLLRPLLRALLFSLLLPAVADAGDGIVHRIVEPSDYTLAREAILDAITGAGLIPGQISHFGDMLARTGPVLGHPVPAYAEAEVFSFCSATVSWALVVEDLQNIALCPLTVAIYTLPAAPERVHFVYREPDGNSEGRRRAQTLLREIVDAASTQARRYIPDSGQPQAHPQ